MTSDPAAPGVKLEEQLDVVVLIATRLHGLGLLNVPAAGVLKRTVPAGALAVPAAEVSFTKAVHDEAWLTTTEAGVQTTVVVVVRLFTVRLNVLELAVWESLGVYAPVITSVPEAEGVKLAEQLEVVELTATSVHGFGLLNVPAAGVLNKTVPAGVVGDVVVSFTNAVQDVAWLTTTVLGLQVTVVEVPPALTVRVNVPELPE
jgi:hypothetical protein